ncbi:MAG: pentapeptide repeat-containing protein [Planctomycetota bacterium]|jgi:hypothetical protein
MDSDTFDKLISSVMEKDGCASWNAWRKDDPQPIDLSGVSLAGADLSGADLSDVNLSGADLSGAGFVGANLTGAILSGAKLQKANLDTSRCYKADFSGADVSGADFGTADISWARFRGANLSGASMGRAKIWKTDFRDSRGAGGLMQDEGTGEFLSGKGGAYTFHFNDERIDKICRIITGKTGRQLVLSEEIDPRQRVTFSANQKSIIEVLDGLCRATNLKYKKTGGAIDSETYYLSLR